MNGLLVYCGGQLQPAERVGPLAPPIKVLLLRYQIAVCRVAGGVKKEVWLPIAVEISRANQLIAAGNIWFKPPAAHTGSR